MEEIEISRLLVYTENSTCVLFDFLGFKPQLTFFTPFNLDDSWGWEYVRPDLQAGFCRQLEKVMEGGKRHHDGAIR